MSTLVKCPNGHYYDPEKHSRCPYCEGGVMGGYGETTMPMDNQWNGDISTTVPTEIKMQEPKVDLDTTIGMAVWTGNGYEGQVGEKIQISPVVGWFVCKKGPEFGKSFNLKAGRNFIGRSEENDVAIKGDQRISRKEHGIVVYDPRAKQFHVQPGNSKELFYVNGKVVLQVEQLKDRDVISLGETELIFVALCNESFSWEDME